MMSEPNTITRPEIAERLGITNLSLCDVIRHTNANLPKPLRKRGHILIYDREIILAWISGDPLAHMTRMHGQNPPSPPLDNVNARRFLTGYYDPPKRQQKRMKRLLAARGASQAGRVVERIRPDQEFIPSTNHWAGLI